MNARLTQPALFRLAELLPTAPPEVLPHLLTNPGNVVAEVPPNNVVAPTQVQAFNRSAGRSHAGRSRCRPKTVGFFGNRIRTLQHALA